MDKQDWREFGSHRGYRFAINAAPTQAGEWQGSLAIWERVQPSAEVGIDPVGHDMLVPTRAAAIDLARRSAIRQIETLLKKETPGAMARPHSTIKRR